MTYEGRGEKFRRKGKKRRQVGEGKANRSAIKGGLETHLRGKRERESANGEGKEDVRGNMSEGKGEKKWIIRGKKKVR